MQCHSTPPITGWRPTPTPGVHDLPFDDFDLDDLDPQIPEPPEHGPVPAVILH